METLYRKVAVSERKPNKSGSYYSDNDKVYYRQSTGRFEHDNDAHCVYPNWWLEEVPDNEESLRQQNKELVQMLEKSIKLLNREYVDEDQLDDWNNRTIKLQDQITELLNKVK